MQTLPRRRIFPVKERTPSSGLTALSNEALTRAKTGAQLDMTKVCDATPVAREYALGKSIGVHGTPAIVTENGDYIEGYMPPHELVQEIKDLQLAKR